MNHSRASPERSGRSRENRSAAAPEQIAAGRLRGSRIFQSRTVPRDQVVPSHASKHRAVLKGPGQCRFRVCAVTRRRFPVGASPTRQTLQPEAIGAVMEVTKWLKPSISVSRIGDSASVQAATRVNAEQSSKRTMRRSTRQPYRGRLIRLDEMSEAIRSDAVPG